MSLAPEYLRGHRWLARARFVPEPSDLERQLLDKEGRLLDRLVDLKAALSQASPEDTAVDALLGGSPAAGPEFDHDAAAREAEAVERELRVLDKAIGRLVEDRHAAGEAARRAELDRLAAEHAEARAKIGRLQAQLRHQYDRAAELQERHFAIDDAEFVSALPHVGPPPPLPPSYLQARYSK